MLGCQTHNGYNNIFLGKSEWEQIKEDQKTILAKKGVVALSTLKKLYLILAAAAAAAAAAALLCPFVCPGMCVCVIYSW